MSINIGQANPAPPIYTDSTKTKVGINSSSPSSILEVKSTSTNSTIMQVTNQSGNAVLKMNESASGQGVLVISNSSGTNTAQIHGGGSPSSSFVSGPFAAGTTSINASAMLQADSTTQGFLPPRMTTTQKNAISSPATGLVVYDTTLNKLCVYTGAGWETVTSS